MKMESIPPVHAIMVINVLLSPNMFWDVLGRYLRKMSKCDCYLPAIMCTQDNFCISWNVSSILCRKPTPPNSRIPPIPCFTETYSSVHSNPKTSIVSQTLQVKATQSHTLLGMCRTETPRDSEPQLHMASELDIGCWWSWVHWAEGRKTLPESLLA